MTEPQENSNKKTNKSPGRVTESEDGYEDDEAGSLASMSNPMLNLPRPIIDRVNALKNIQLRMVNIETKFYEELHQLECKYTQMYEPLFEQRQKIVSGEYEPTAEEKKWNYEDIFESSNAAAEKSPGVDEVAELAADLDKAKLLDKDNQAEIKGIPGFWLQAFKNTDIIGEMIQEWDEPVLKHLKDVRVKMNAQKPYGYSLEFLFTPNEWFTNDVLTKSYLLAIDLNQDDRDPLSYDGPIIYKCEGCRIDWTAKSKDVTVKLVKKKQKHKGTGTIRVVTKEEKQDSFFNFFDAPTDDGFRPSYRHYMDPLVREEDDIDEELEQLCEADFELGHFFKEFMIPKSVLYFTGELVDEANSYDDDYEDDEEDMAGGEFDEDDDSDDDDAHAPPPPEDKRDKPSNKNKNKSNASSQPQLTQRVNKNK